MVHLGLSITHQSKATSNKRKASRRYQMTIPMKIFRLKLLWFGLQKYHPGVSHHKKLETSVIEPEKRRRKGSRMHLGRPSESLNNRNHNGRPTQKLKSYTAPPEMIYELNRSSNAQNNCNNFQISTTTQNQKWMMFRFFGTLNKN